MPAYKVNQGWTDPIQLQAGDTLQNRGLNQILISRSEPPSELDALSLAPSEPFTAQAAMTVCASTGAPTISRLVVAPGLAVAS